MRPSTIGAILAMAILNSGSDGAGAEAQTPRRPCRSPDIHYLSDPTGLTLTRIDTKASRDQNGTAYREILNAQRGSAGSMDTSSACPVGAHDSLQLNTVMLGSHPVYYPASTPIERIEFDSLARALILTLPATRDRPNVVSVAFPQDLLPNNGYLARVVLDGSEVDASETTNAQMRSLSVRIASESRTVRIEGVSLANTQMSSWSAGLLGFLFAFVVVFAVRLRRMMTS